MPVELQIIRAAEFIRMNSQGEFDLDATCSVLASLAEACKRRGIHRALVDIRKARADLNPSEIALLVSVFREVGFTRDLRLAILHPGDRHARARLFAFISRMKGWCVRAFDDFECALSWLSLHPDRPQPTAPGSEKRIPISHSQENAKLVAISSHSTRHDGCRRSGPMKI